MLFRQKLLNGAYMAMAGGEEGSSSSMQNGADKGQQQQQQQSTQKTAEELAAEQVDKIWEKPKSDDEDKDKGTQISSEQINEALDKHVKGMDLLNGIDTDAIMTGLSESNPEALVNALSLTAQNTIKNLIPTMVQLIDKKTEAAVERAVSSARGQTRTDLAYQNMERQLPFTKGNAVNPVAKAVMRQALEKGSSEEEAVTVVKNFFKQVTSAAAKDLKPRTPPRSRPGRGLSQEDAAIAENSDEGDEIDWEGMFKGQ